MEIIKIKQIYFTYIEDSEIKDEEKRNMSRKYSFSEKTREFNRNAQGEVSNETESTHNGVLSISFDLDQDIETQVTAKLRNTALPTTEVFFNDESIGYGTN